MNGEQFSSPHRYFGETFAPDTLRILVLEDELSDYELIVRHLRASKLNFEALCVDSESDFEHQLIAFAPDLVLSDFALPDYDGFRALETLHRQSPETPFILVTGTLNEARAFEAVKRGATDFVLKGRLDRLPVSVNRAVNERAERSKLQKAQEQALQFFQKRQQSALADANARPVRILLLEDEPSDVALLERELTGQVAFVLTVVDDEVGYCEALKTFDPDIIIADFALPSFNGLAALEIRDQVRSETPFIFLSGIIGEHLAIEAVKSGATDYVLKDNLYCLPVAVSRAIRETNERRLRVEAEKNLEFNQLLRTITDNTVAALFLLDAKGKVMFANRSAEKLTKYSFGELEGRSFHEMIHSRRPNGAELQESDCPLHRVADVPHTIRTWDDLFFRKDGKPFNAIYSCTPIVGTVGGAGSVVELIDITSEREAQLFSQSLLAINDELQLLAQVVSHELQEPVGKIRSYLGLLSTRYRERLGRDADEFIDICVTSATTISLMIDDLWTYARINKLDVQLSYVDTSIIAAATIEELRGKIEVTRGIVNFGKLPVVFGNDRQIAYLLRSLIDNALKFHGTEAPVVRISAREDGGQWVFAVKDNGIGIDKIYSKDVFRLFHRLNAKPGVTGTGMGLSICKKIVEREQGNIWFESEPGRGSTFYFSLPTKPQCAINAAVISQREFDCTLLPGNANSGLALSQQQKHSGSEK